MNEFIGSKNGGREVWVGLEWPENSKIRRPTVTVAAAFAGPILASPAAVGREILPARSPCQAHPPWPARVTRGWPKKSPTARTHLA